MTNENELLAPAGADSSPAEIAAATERVRRITGAVRQEDTTVTLPSPMAEGWHLTWTADDVQLAVLADGAVNEPGDLAAFHGRVYAVRGTPPDIELERVTGIPEMIMRARESGFASYWGSSILAVDGQVYVLLSTTNHPYLLEDGSFWPDFRGIGAKLIHSPDNGTTWNNQDGSHPVVWEDWDARSRDNMMFFEEEQAGLTGGGLFLQMGRDYSLNTDGYVYAYFRVGQGTGIGVWRAPRGRLRDREAHEVFTGRLHDGTATWSSDPLEATALHDFPDGWESEIYVDREITEGWLFSVTYNPGLGVYLLAGQGVGVSADDEAIFHAKAGYLGLWAGPTPWGPFTQFHEEIPWATGGDPRSRPQRPDIPPKWISDDGRSFHLVWSDFRYVGDNGETYGVDAALVAATKDVLDDTEHARAFAEWFEKHLPGLVFHTQRVDLTVQ